MKITALYAALITLLFVALSLRVVLLRKKHKVGVGYGDAPQLLRAARVHSNLAEYAPFALLLMLLIEMQQGSSLFLHALGVTLLIARLAHAYGVSQVKEPMIFRQVGMILTFTCLISSSIYLLSKTF